ncbi:hypothetical protein BpHYR1_047279 [Brachionus plicatilis]|uniref:Uncharacterized protein n=1 Tax=Brachionus plicatilis TaxID=10195 RepID=A0A3M7PC06_BRAPC|nr:hypothetical protein BpHYR1_047279 [Brachionus plicatilis]
MALFFVFELQNVSNVEITLKKSDNSNKKNNFKMKNFLGGVVKQSLKLTKPENKNCPPNSLDSGHMTFETVSSNEFIDQASYQKIYILLGCLMQINLPYFRIFFPDLDFWKKKKSSDLDL